MSAYDGRVVTATGAPAYTARPGFASAPPPRPTGPPRCACADSRHHVPGLACGLILTEPEADAGRYRCAPCAVLSSDPVAYAIADGATPLDPAVRRQAAQDLIHRRTVNGRPIPKRLALIALTEETPAPMTPDTRAAIADATATPPGPPATIPVITPELVAATALDETDTDPRRPEADNVAPANTREPVEEPLPVLLDRLATATAYASAVKAVVDDLRPRVEAAAIRRHAEEGTDRYRREAALITLRFGADRIVVEDEPALRELLNAYEDLDTYRAEVTPGRERQLYEDLITVGGALLDAPAGAPTVTIPAELAERLVEAVSVTRELDPTRALTAVEEELGATVTKSGVVVADTGEPVSAIRVERGRPSGVQVRTEAEHKAAVLADVRALLA